MKKGSNKFDSVYIVSRLRSLHLLMGLVFVYCFLMTTQFPALLRFLENTETPPRFTIQTSWQKKPPGIISNLVFTGRIRNDDNSSIYKSGMQAWLLGSELWRQLKNPKGDEGAAPETATRCPEKVSETETEFNGMVKLPCGLTVGSHITVVGQVKKGHEEKEPSISLGKDVMVSQFMVELRREKVVRGEELRKR